MPFITQGKTNWKFLVAVFILAIIVGGGIWYLQKKQLSNISFINTIPAVFSNQNKAKGEVKSDCLNDSCSNIQESAQKEECYYEKALDCRNDNFCQGIESRNKQSDCYVGVAEVEGAIKNNNPSQCWLYLAPYVNSACWKSFGMGDWQTYKNNQYGFELKYPLGWKTISEFPGRLGPGQTEPIEGVNPQSFLFAPNDKDLTKNEADVTLYTAPAGYFNCSSYTNLSDDNINNLLKQNINNNEIEFCKSNIYFRFSVATLRKDFFNQILSTFKFISEEKPITVLSPNGGEEIKAGKTYTIIWSANNNVKNIIITLMENSSKSYLINKPVDASLGKFDWKTNNTADYVGKDNLRVVLYDSAYCGYVDQSTGVECIKDGEIHSDASDDYFSIVE